MDILKQEFTILEQKIFIYLSLRSGEKFSQRELSILLNVSPTAIAKSLTKLKEENYIKIEKVKNINLVYFNRDNKEAINIKRCENLKKIYTSKLQSYLKEELAGSTIILFGSYAKGEDYKNSDIDIAVIGRDKKELKLTMFETKLFRKININYYKKLEEIHKNLRNNIINGIVLSGGLEF